MTGIIPQLLKLVETPFTQVAGTITVDLSPVKGKIPLTCFLELNNGKLAIVDNSSPDYNLNLPLSGFNISEKLVFESSILVKNGNGAEGIYLFTNSIQALTVTRNLTLQLNTLYPVGNPQGVSKIYFSTIEQQLSNI